MSLKKVEITNSLNLVKDDRREGFWLEFKDGNAMHVGLDFPGRLDKAMEELMASRVEKLSPLFVMLSAWKMLDMSGKDAISRNPFKVIEETREMLSTQLAFHKIEEEGK